MSFSERDVMYFVRNCLGDNPEGLFVDSEVISGDLRPDESDIYTNISENTTLGGGTLQIMSLMRE